MKSLLIASLVLANICEIAATCCNQKTLLSCCGKGKCNIFCCNCHGGCNKGCESDIPFCLAFGEQVECTGSVNKPHSILARNLPELAGSEEENAMFRAADAEDIPYCQVFNDSRVRCSSSIKPPTENRDFHLATSAGSDNDEDMFKAADVNGVGYFTYDQFLAHTNSTNDVPTTLYFQKYHRNGDGVITLDEMRLDDGEGKP